MMQTYNDFNSVMINEKGKMDALLLCVEEKQTQGGNPYCVLDLCDKTGETIKANFWNKEKTYFENLIETVVVIQFSCKKYKEEKSWVIDDIGFTSNEASEIAKFIPRSPLDSEKGFNSILSFLRKKIAEKKDDEGNVIPDLVTLTSRIYMKHREEILHCAAAKSVHHNYIGGYIEHTYGVLRRAAGLAEDYGADMELTLCGIVLHDIGKLKELSTSNVGAVEYTLEGELLGHIILGIKMIEEERMLEDPEKKIYTESRITELEHVIASHHGKLEFGAAKVPACKAAFIVSVLDNLDAKMKVFDDAEKKMEPGTVSAFNRFADTKIYKGFQP